MTRNQLNVALASVLTTLAECGEAPEGHLYAALMTAGLTLDDYHVTAGLLIQSELAERITGPQLKVTEKGRALAERINATIAG